MDVYIPVLAEMASPPASSSKVFRTLRYGADVGVQSRGRSLLRCCSQVVASLSANETDSTPGGFASSSSRGLTNERTILNRPHLVIQRSSATRQEQRCPSFVVTSSLVQWPEVPHASESTSDIRLSTHLFFLSFIHSLTTLSNNFQPPQSLTPRPASASARV